MSTNKVKKQYRIVDQSGKQVAKFSSDRISEVWKKYNKRCQELLGANAESKVNTSVFGQIYWTNKIDTLVLEEIK